MKVDADKAIKLYRQGKSLRKIGDELGVSYNAVWLAIHKHRDYKPRHTTRYDIPPGFVQSELESGKSYRQISNETGLSLAALHQRAHSKCKEPLRDDDFEKLQRTIVGHLVMMDVDFNAVSISRFYTTGGICHIQVKNNTTGKVIYIPTHIPPKQAARIIYDNLIVEEGDGT